MSLSIVTTADRPDLAALTARWRWEAFFRGSGRPFDDILADAQKTAAAAQLMPRTFVLLMEGEPVGTASLVAHDLEERPDLTPWLAGVFVVPHARGRGYAARLVAAVEQAAAAAGIPTCGDPTRACGSPGHPRPLHEPKTPRPREAPR